jgi:ornithine carbamoyltransferase
VRVRHLLDVDDLSAAEIAGVMAFAEKREVDRVLHNKGVLLYFEKPSLRTRNSFELAASVLGASVSVVTDAEIGIGRREEVRDVARTMACFNTVVGMRVRDHRVLEQVRDAVTESGYTTSVVNLLSDRAHPCQALADALTIRQEMERLGYEDFSELKAAFVGDANNVCRSFSLLCALLGIQLVVASPKGYELEEEFVGRVRSLGGKIELTNDPREAASNASVIYTDTWVSMGQEGQTQARVAAFSGFQVDDDLVALADPRVFVLHCMPAHKGMEISESVFERHAQTIFKQATNRFHTARALLWWLATIGGAGSGHWPNVLSGGWRQEL